MAGATLRIGCGSGFWGDSPEGAHQLVEAGVDVLVFDYLAEITMALLAQTRTRDPEAGFVPDFIDYVIRPHAKAIAAQNIKIVANAGGMNPLGCKLAVEKALAAAGVERRVAVVTGDDLLAQADALRADGVDLPPNLVSLNAYLGARPIAAALAAGADIVITGRCVDSALVLGPLVHAFGWDWNDYDRLAQGSLAGHIVECGCQATGGILTDWEDEAWDRIGYPIVECGTDGSFVVTKPEGTGGWVSLASVGEQIVYEVGDPAAYALPDVICDWRDIRLIADGDNRVRVTGARGRAPGGKLKLSAVASDGFRASGELTIGGRQVALKARKTGEAILTRTRRMMMAAGFGDYAETLVEVLGAGALYGPYVATPEIREVLLRVSVRHSDRKALTSFSQEFLASATSMAQGITGISGGRPRTRPLLRHKGVFLDAGHIGASVAVGEQRLDIASTDASLRVEAPAPLPSIAAARVVGERCIAPLIAYAYGRSGDKGDIANIGVIARRADYLPVLADALSESAVAQWFAHLVKGPVHRYDWPGLPGFNFVMENALGGGGTASLRIDPQGKTYAQILMDFPVPGPAAWFAPDGPLAAWRDA